MALYQLIFLTWKYHIPKWSNIAVNGAITKCEECATDHAICYWLSIVLRYIEFTKSMGILSGDNIQNIRYVACCQNSGEVEMYNWWYVFVLMVELLIALTRGWCTVVIRSMMYLYRNDFNIVQLQGIISVLWGHVMWKKQPSPPMMARVSMWLP